MSREEGEAMGSGRPKTRTLYSLFSKVPVSRPMISSADEEAFQGLPSDLTGFTWVLYFRFSRSRGLKQSKKARKREE